MSSCVHYNDHVTHLSSSLVSLLHHDHPHGIISSYHLHPPDHTIISFNLASLSLDGKVYAHKAFSNAHSQYQRGRYGTTLLTPNIAVVVAGSVKGILKVSV